MFASRKLFSILFAISLSACAGKPTVVEVPTPVTPPAKYLEDCVAKLVPLRTNADMAINYQALQRALKLCNADKAAIRAWAASLSDEQVKGVLEDMAANAPS